MIQIQIPSPSTAHHSLLSEFFAPNNSTSEDDEKDSQLLNQLQHQQLEFATPTFALRAQPSPFEERTIQRSGPENNERTSRNARKVTRRGVTRRRSPSQKIDVLKKEEERDENGNPVPTCGPLTCFSYRTMEQEYEKDTLRMLERIQKSRSFEKKPKQEHDPAGANNPLQWSCPQLTSYSEVAAAATANETFRVEDDAGFFIGEYEEGAEAEANDCVLVEDYAQGETMYTEPPCYEQDKEEEEEEEEDDGIFALEL